MRYILDLQGAQSESRFRGIRRYSLSLARAMFLECGTHEVGIVLNGQLSETIEELRLFFDGLLPKDHIWVFDPPGPVGAISPVNAWRTRTAEKLRECFLADLKPDVVHISSLFEGFVDDAVTSVDSFAKPAPTAITFYDLIPLLRRADYLTYPEVRLWYFQKLRAIKCADLLLAISKASQKEAVDHLGIPEEKIAVVPAAIDELFRPVIIAPADRDLLLSRYGIVHPFIMYTGGADPRKNLNGLLQALAQLSPEVISSHQLVIVGSIGEPERDSLLRLRQTLALPPHLLVFTGYVTDGELISLYNLCRVVVLPSFHEGFGLPALEAMACGVPTIGSNTSSIPEVIGCRDALFDPTRPIDIAAKIEMVLTSEAFCSKLREHGLERSRLFSWKRSAEAAWNALEELQDQQEPSSKSFSRRTVSPRPNLAYVSPLVSKDASFKRYTNDLIRELDRFYKITIITPNTDIGDDWIRANINICDPQYLLAHFSEFDHVVYDLNNTQACAYMWYLLQHCPGTIVLHTFNLGRLPASIGSNVDGLFSDEMLRSIYYSHGYPAIVRLRDSGGSTNVSAYPCNRVALDAAMGIIVHARHFEALGKEWYGSTITTKWSYIPMPRSKECRSIVATPPEVEINPLGFNLCCASAPGNIELATKMICAWISSGFGRDLDCSFHILVENPNEVDVLASILEEADTNSVRIYYLPDSEERIECLIRSDVAVVLGCPSQSLVTAVALLVEAVPAIIAGTGWSAELPSDVAIIMDEKIDSSELAVALERLRNDTEYRDSISRAAGEYSSRVHHPARVASIYRDALEQFAATHPVGREARLLKEVAVSVSGVAPNLKDLEATALELASLRPIVPRSELLLDVSETARFDAGTGIQRVARHLTLELICDPPPNYYPEAITGWCEPHTYARDFVAPMLGVRTFASNEVVQARPGDLYVALDLSPESISQRRFFRRLQACRVPIYFVLYDLLPIFRPHSFPAGMAPAYTRWLTGVLEFADGVACISQAVADELLRYLDEVQPERSRPLSVGYFHLGADFQERAATAGLTADCDAVLASVRSRPSILMVGTIEPRKGHKQALGALELLWRAGVEANLVIIGKVGWMMDDFNEELKHHRELGNRLFVLNDVSDKLLLRLYAVSAGLLAASEAEGFGLPLIEAARNKLRIIARDIPVFHEVAGDHAFYFDGTTPDSLASTLRTWLDLYRQGTAPTSEGLRWLTWKQSAAQLMEFVVGRRAYRRWRPARKQELVYTEPTETVT